MINDLSAGSLPKLRAARNSTTLKRCAATERHSFQRVSAKAHQRKIPAEQDYVLISPAKCAERLGVSLATVRRYLASGVLPKIQFGTRKRVFIPWDIVHRKIVSANNLETDFLSSAHDAEAVEHEPTQDRPSGPKPKWMKRCKK